MPCSRYLVKLDLPPEISADGDVAEVYEQYEELIEQFKLVHRDSENMKNSGYSTAELRYQLYTHAAIYINIHIYIHIHM